MHFSHLYILKTISLSLSRLYFAFLTCSHLCSVNERSVNIEILIKNNCYTIFLSTEVYIYNCISLYTHGIGFASYNLFVFKCRLAFGVLEISCAHRTHHRPILDACTFLYT